MQILLRILALGGRLDGANVIEQHPRHVEQLLIVLNLVSVLEEGAHHPQMRQHTLQALDRFGGTHGEASGAECGAVVTATAGDFAGGCGASAASLEYNTKAAPAPTNRIPTHNSQRGKTRPKCKGCPGRGCQTMLTSVLMTGARPKMRGAM